MGDPFFDSATTDFDDASVFFDADAASSSPDGSGFGASGGAPEGAYRVLCGPLLAVGYSEEIPVHDLDYTFVLNAAGAMSGWISMDDPRCTRTLLDPGATAIYIERGGILVWGGILWTAKPDTGTRQLMLGAEGFISYFTRKRRIRTTKDYTAGVDQLAIVRDLINYAQAQPGGSIGVSVGAELCGHNTNPIYYNYDRTELGQAIQDLAAASSPLGFDFSIDVGWDVGGTRPQKLLRLYYPRQGTRIDGLVFDGSVKGVSRVTDDVDATTMTNLWDTIGNGSGDSMLIATSADTTLLSRYPLMEDSVAYKGVEDQTILQSLSDAQLGRYRLPLETVTLEKKGTTWPDVGSFSVGDEGLMRSADGWMTFEMYGRVQQIEIQVDDQGQENMIPTLVNSDLSRT